MNKFWCSSFFFFLFHNKLCLYWKYVMDHLYPSFDFFFFFQPHYHTSTYPITRKNKIRTKHKIEPQHILLSWAMNKFPCLMNTRDKICSMFKQTPSALEQVWKYGTHIKRYIDLLTYSFFLVQESFFLINHFNKWSTCWTLTN